MVLPCRAVMKFGGTSVLGPRGTDRVASVLADSPAGVVAVVSAMAGTTDVLLHGVEAAAAGRPGLEEAAAATRRAHLAAARHLLTGRELEGFVAHLEQIETVSTYGAI